MKFYFQKYKYPVYLIAIAAIWLVLVTIVMQLQHQVFIFGDSKSYLIAAQELFLEHKLNSQRPVVISFINGFPLLLSCSKSVFFGWSLFVNLVCWFATILLILGIVWLSQDLGYLKINVPWIPVILIIVAVGMIWNRFRN